MEAGARVLLVDDDPSVRQAVGRLLRAHGLEVELLASAGELLERLPHDGPCCVVLDVMMPGENGVELHRRLSASEDAPAVVFLTAHGDIPMGVEAMKRGAVDFLTKPVDGEVLLRAVERALQRDEADREARRRRGDVAERVRTLTPRESQVFELVADGLPNKQIAFDLGITEKTVKAHRGRVMRKLRATSLADVVRAAGLDEGR